MKKLSSFDTIAHHLPEISMMSIIGGIVATANTTVQEQCTGNVCDTVTTRSDDNGNVQTCVLTDDSRYC